MRIRAASFGRSANVSIGSVGEIIALFAWAAGSGQKADGSIVRLVCLSAVPWVLPEERRKQEDEPRKETGESHNAEVKAAVIRSIKCDSHKTQDAYHAAGNPYERRHFLLFTQAVSPSG